MFIGRTDAEAEAPIVWPPDVKSWFIGKDLYAQKDWRQEEKGTTEDEMVGWHHWLNGLVFEQALGDGEGEGRLCAAVHGVAKSQTRLSNWTINNNNNKNLSYGWFPLLSSLHLLVPFSNFHFFEYHRHSLGWLPGQQWFPRSLFWKVSMWSRVGHSR